MIPNISALRSWADCEAERRAAIEYDKLPPDERTEEILLDLMQKAFEQVSVELEMRYGRFVI